MVEVLNVTKFLPDHPGGELAILTFAGKDATAEFNMIHPPDVIGKYAPDAVIGKVGAAPGLLRRDSRRSSAVKHTRSSAWWRFYVVAPLRSMKEKDLPQVGKRLCYRALGSFRLHVGKKTQKEKEISVLRSF